MQNFTYKMEIDKKYYQKLVKADFFERKDMIFIKDFVKNFDKIFNELLKKGKTNIEIEMYMNHLDMEFLSTIYKKQKKLGKNIIKKWSKKLKKQFPDKKLILELVDEGGGYVIYLYTAPGKKIKAHDKTNKTALIRQLL